MARFETGSTRFDPYKNFRFRLKMDGRAVAGFSRVTGLGVNKGLEGIREAGSPRVPHLQSFEAITLERGVTHDIAFEQWMNRIWGPRAARDYSKDLVLEVLNEAGERAAAFKIYRCWVSEFSALPELDANANAVAIETIKLENEGWERE